MKSFSKIRLLRIQQYLAVTEDICGWVLPTSIGLAAMMSILVLCWSNNDFDCSSFLSLFRRCYYLSPLTVGGILWSVCRIFPDLDRSISNQRNKYCLTSAVLVKVIRHWSLTMTLISSSWSTTKFHRRSDITNRNKWAMTTISNVLQNTYRVWVEKGQKLP